MGFFDLDLDLDFEENYDYDDIMDMELDESGEFNDRCGSFHPEEHFDSDCSGNWTISVPGGYNERPSARSDEYGPTPDGGLNERPSARPDEYGPTIPSKVVLDSDAYNNTIKQLQQSFKECNNVLQSLIDVRIINETAESKQERLIDEAVVQACEEGPYFESVAREDKKIVRTIARKIRREAQRLIQEIGYKTMKLGSLIKGGKFARQHAWQIVGCVQTDEKNIANIQKKLNSKFKQSLDKYKIFGVKINNGIYAFVVDNKKPTVATESYNSYDDIDDYDIMNESLDFSDDWDLFSLPDFY